MSEAQRASYVSRDAILKLMSNDEIAKVSTAETAAGLKAGDEYLDLEHLEHGIQKAGTAATVNMGQAVPRSAVSNETWSRILDQLVVRP
jgi:hypothetical protein